MNSPKKEAYDVFSSLPSESRIYPTELLENHFDKFSNIDRDTKNSKRILGVRVQKLRGNFTDEEREEKRQAAIEKQKEKKKLRLLTENQNN